MLRNKMGDVENSLQEKLKEEIEEWCIDSTSHGIPRIVKSKSIILKIVWTIFFLGSFSYCTYTLVKTIIKYTNYDVRLQISTVEDLPATFPAVTFCNINPINEEYSADILSDFFQKIEKQINCNSNFSLDDCISKCGNYNEVENNYDNCMLSCETSNETQTINYYDFGFSYECFQNCSPLLINYSICENACYDKNDKCDRLLVTNNSKSVLIDKFKRYIANKNKNFTDRDRYNYGYDLGYDMLISCEYNKVQCSADNFTKYWDNQYGYCYTFNKGNDTTPPLKSSLTGESHGLVMQLVVSKLIKLNFRSD